MAIVQPKTIKYRILGAHVLMLAFILIIMFPLLMVTAISFRHGNFSVGSIIPTGSEFSLEHWKLALGIPTEINGKTVNPPFPVLHWLFNSVYIAILTSLFILVLSTTSAYAFARLRFHGKETILNIMLVVQMFPTVLALVAIYALFDKLGEYIPSIGLNTHGGLILSYMDY